MSSGKSYGNANTDWRNKFQLNPVPYIWSLTIINPNILGESSALPYIAQHVYQVSLNFGMVTSKVWVISYGMTRMQINPTIIFRNWWHMHQLADSIGAVALPMAGLRAKLGYIQTEACWTFVEHLVWGVLWARYREPICRDGLVSSPDPLLQRRPLLHT